MDKVILIGYFSETSELCEKCGFEIYGYVDNEKKGPFEYLGNDEIFMMHYSDYIDIPLVVTPDNPDVREDIYKKYHELGFRFKTLISPDAIVSKSATISEGCMIQGLCNVSSNTFLEKCVRVNTGANIMHDCYVGSFSVVAPAAVILGHVKVESNSYIGANSTILPNVSIGTKAIVGAGAVVTKDVFEGTVVVGVPAKTM